jgi:hypothetical protein
MSAGGTTASGGATGSGGVPQSGGTSGSGGLASSGGVLGSGGATAATGGSNTGGAKTGGSGGGAGSPGSGGVVATGGSTSNDGSVGSGGSTGTCPVVDFGTWPSGQAPTDIGPLAVTSFKPHTGDAYTSAGYAWTFAYFGALQFTKLTADTTNNSYLISHFDCTQAGPSTSGAVAVDVRAFGDLPLEVFLENQDAKCKTLGMTQADAQWGTTADTAVTPDARYWSDDMFMITGLQDFAYRATKDAKYLNRMALTMVAYLQALQQSDGLFWHTKQSKAYWGRANGWFASGMALLLQDLPKSNSNYDTIMAGYKKQMDGLLPVQITSGTSSGMWHQVLDVSTSASYPESSCSAMFTYALVTGVKNGWLTDTKYITAAKNGWLALSSNAKGTGQLSSVCPGSDQAPAGDLASQQAYYEGKTPGTNDMHGQAPLLWAATALLRTDCPGVR